jgi:hypothetical protein
MRNPHGHTYEITTDGGTVSGDTFQCGHCGRHSQLKAFVRPEDMGGFCQKCMQPICSRCAGEKTCDPMEAKLDRWEKQGMIT